MKKATMYIIVTVAACFGAYKGSIEGYDQAKTWIVDKYYEIRSKLSTVEYVHVPEAEQSTEELIERISRKHEIPSLITKAIIVQESGRGMRPDRMRYEEHLQRRFKRDPYINDIEYQMLATSFGLTQVVYGLHKGTCNLQSYADLFDREKNLECGLTVLKKCLDVHKNQQISSDRLRKALGCYNGDGTGGYASKVMAVVADLVVDQM